MSQQINLLGVTVRKQRASLTSARAMAAGVGIIAVVTTVFGLYESVRLTRVEAEARAVAKSFADAKAQRDPAAAVARKPDPALEAKLADLAKELKARQEVLDALKRGTVGSTAGFSEYLRAFSRQRVEGVWLTGFDITAGGADLTISGRALNADLVPAYLQRLNKETPMQGRRFASVVINRPSAQDAAKSGQPTGEPAVAALPPYLEFTLSSAGEGAKAAEKADTRALAWRGPLEAEMRGEKAKAGP